MTVLKRVDWPAVFGRLLDDADDELRERAFFYAGLRSVVPAPVAVFACLVSGSPGLALYLALGDLDTDSAIALRFWLSDTAHVVLSAAGQLGDPRVPGEPAVPGALLLDPDLEHLHLPLLDLAADVARTRGLAVAAGGLRPGVAGSYSPRERRITLDLARGVDERTWAHELSHALDPLIGQRQAIELDERYADDLGALLLAHRPATVEAAQPMIAECARTRTDGEGDGGSGSRGQDQTEHEGAGVGLPEPGAASLLAFLTLEVTHG